MGSCESVEHQKNREIDKELKSDYEAEKKIVKLLLLGAAEGGKSTILKQMKIIHSNGFPEEERAKKKGAIHKNVLAGMASLILGMKKLELAFEHPNVEKSVEKIMATIKKADEHQQINWELLEAIKRVWKDKNLQEKAIPRGNEFQFLESCPYFFNDLDRICASDYLPTIQDILMLRISTTGIVEIKKVHFRVFDVGGQRSERKKWIHCFDNVNAIIFVAALSEFDQVLCEDTQTNRMIESMKLFHTVCNSRWFYKCAMILFLNKKDLFAKKIRHSSIKAIFHNYKGTDTYEDQVKYIKDKYGEMNLHPNKVIYTHETCATDTNQIQLILDNVVDLLLRQILNAYGMY